jgi:hypothetical protein
LQSNLKRIERLFPAVYVTLISILLGFAIEDLINRIRELSSINIYAVLVAISILCAIFAAWTGYSFVSMTQERLPRLLDCVNVFVLAFGVYLLNSTLGMEIWFFFCSCICLLRWCPVCHSIQFWNFATQPSHDVHDAKFSVGHTTYSS